MNACPHWNDHLLDSALGALHSSAVDQLEDHLQQCKVCSAALVELRLRRERLDTALKQFIRGPEPSPAFRTRVLAAVEASSVRTAARPAWVGTLAAVAVVVLAGVFLPSLAERWASVEQSAPPAVVALSQWRSPTDSLLRSSADELLQSGPRLGEFYFSLDSLPSGMSDENGGNDES